MIAENIEPLEDERPTLTEADTIVLMHILLKTVNGITVPQKTFDEYNREDMKLSRKWNPVNRCWNFFVPQKRKRGVIKPRKKLILPGDQT